METGPRIDATSHLASPYLMRFATAALATFVVIYLCSLVLMWESHTAWSMSVSAGALAVISVIVAAVLAAVVKRSVLVLVVSTQTAVIVLIGLVTTWAPWA